MGQAHPPKDLQDGYQRRRLRQHITPKCANQSVIDCWRAAGEEEEGADIPTEGSGIQEKSKSAALARRLVIGARVEKGKEEYQVGLSGITWKNRGHEKIG